MVGWLATCTLLLQGFNPLKVVFPGRIKRQQKDVAPSVGERGTDSADEGCGAGSTSSTDAGRSAAGASTSRTGGEEVTPHSTLPPFGEARLRKFGKLLDAPIVDLTALQEVRSTALREVWLIAALEPQTISYALPG